MSARMSALSLCALFCTPALASAGPIAFTIGTGNLTASAGAPQLGTVLVPGDISNQAFTAELNGTSALVFSAVAYEPWRLSAPAPRDVHPDGTSHWNNDGYFTVDVSLTDVASGESATFQMSGRAHVYSTYSAGQGWGGSTVFWFTDNKELTLGGNAYTVRGGNQFAGGPAVLDVWVGSGAPVLAPEPGTFALAALGLAPFGLRRLRRVW